MKDVISAVADKASAEQFEERYARMLVAMSMEQALMTLGFGPKYRPTAEELQKAYRSKAIENHPDRGGNPEKMVEINVAKDIIEGKARPSGGGGGAGRPPPGGWRPDDSVRKERPEPPKVVDVIEGQAFSIPGFLMGVTEIKFISKTAYGSARPTKDAPREYSYDMWAIYGWNESNKTHIFVALRHRREDYYFDATKGGKVVIEESWEYIQDKYPGSKDLMKIASASIKKVMTGWDDGLKPSRQLKYIAWPGGKLTETTLAKVRAGGYSGGAPLKDIVIGQGLAKEEDAVGRKSNVEIYFKSNKEKRRVVVDAARSGQRMNMWQGYDWFVRVNGTEYPLSDKSVEKLAKKYFFDALDANKMGEGVPKNLSKMKGGHGRFSLALKAHEIIEKLIDGLVSEPSGLVLGLMKALEDWEGHDSQSKKAALRAMVARTDLHEAAHLSGLEVHEVLRAWE